MAMLDRAKTFRLPGTRERLAVFGRTGSGKTRFLVWNLSMSSITELPWIIIDHKDDGYLKKLPRVEQISLKELPKYPGVYYISAKFEDDEEVDLYLKRHLAKGNRGLFTDEGASIPQREPRFLGLKSLFAQGRSKRTPVLFATQRPAWINKSVLSESDYFALFHLHYEDDKERARTFFPQQIDERLDDYHSHWYDVKQDAYFRLGPVNEAEYLERLDDRLRPPRHFV